MLLKLNLGRKLDPNKEINFNIYGFRNPLSGQLTSGFFITTYDSNGGKIDQSEPLKIQSTVLSPITTYNLQIESGSRAVGE